MRASTASPAQQPQRRTQEERRDATQRILLEATLRCLGRQGYASTSISEIIKEAGVSRGALLHHYPNKIDLVAAAIDYFSCERLKRFEEELLGNDMDRSDLTLSDRIRVLKEDFEQWFDVSLECAVALRTNPELQQAFDALSADRTERMLQQYEKLFPEFEDTQSSRMLITVLACFLRGLCPDSTNSDSDSERTEAVFQQFLEIFEAYQQSRKKNTAS